MKSQAKEGARQSRSRAMRVARSNDAILEAYLKDLEKTIAHIRKDVLGRMPEFISQMDDRSRKRPGGLL